MIDYHEVSKLKTAYVQKCKELETVLSEYCSLAETMAEKERLYILAKAQSILILKQEGHPVTLISDLAKGAVADQKFDYHVAEATFNACRENIKRIHANLDAYRSLLSVAKAEIEVR